VRAAGALATALTADVVCSASLAAAAAAIVAELGPPDVWINCAGNGVYGRFDAVPEAQFDRVTAVTYGGTVNGCRVALALMSPRGTGTIVNVCSAAAFHGLPLMTSYAGAKAAVRGFSQGLQAELRIEGSAIRVSTVFPPAVNTPFFSHAISHMKWPARPMPPVYQPEVVAAGIYFAATRGKSEVIVSGTALAFSFMTRLSPRLTAFLMCQLGFDAQLSRDEVVAQLEEPTLFAPPAQASPVHGPFGHRARRGSVQVWVNGGVLAALGLLGRTMARWARNRPAPLSRAKPVPPTPHPARDGSAARPGVV
jgi:short-subunit dehydrogenase